MVYPEGKGSETSKHKGSVEMIDDVIVHYDLLYVIMKCSKT